MTISKKFFSFFLSLALILACISPQTAFAATYSVEPSNIPEPTVISTENGSTIEIFDFTSEGRSGTLIGTSGGEFRGGGTLTISSQVTGRVGKTIKILGNCVSGNNTTTMVVYGNGCGNGKTIPVNGNTYTLATGLNITNQTYAIGINDVNNTYRIVLFLYD